MSTDPNLSSSQDGGMPPIPPRRPFLDESSAPKVDREVLAALVRGELEPELSRSVYRLIASFRSWDEVHTELLIALHDSDAGDGGN